VYHDVPERQVPEFAAQLRHLARRWRFISPSEFNAIVLGEESLRDRCLLLTFDDGFISNRLVAEAVLEPMGIRAIFFVVPGFVDIDERAKARRYVVERIQPGRRESSLDGGLANMDWNDLAVLLERGHSIGAHTLTHARLSTVAAVSDLEREIIGSGEAIAARLGTSVTHFAYPYGEVSSVTERAISIAAMRYPFVLSGVRGNNRSASSLAIRRDSVAPLEALGVVDAFLEGLVDVWYAKSRKVLDDWASRAKNETTDLR
jgi:peptidoglycan/xylan/chitin deacetylase (PgdA/CDA1 family)